MCSAVPLLAARTSRNSALTTKTWRSPQPLLSSSAGCKTPKYLLKAFQEDDSAAAAKRRSISKMERVAGMHWIITLDHILQFLCHKGLDRFMLAPEDPLRASSIVDLAKRPDLNVKRPLLVVASDQGGEGFKPSAGWCLPLAGPPLRVL